MNAEDNALTEKTLISKPYLELLGRLEESLDIHWQKAKSRQRLEQNIKIILALKGWNIQTLAAKSKRDRGFMSKILSGKWPGKIKVETFLAIAAALEVPPSVLLEKDLRSELQKAIYP